MPGAYVRVDGDTVCLGNEHLEAVLQVMRPDGCSINLPGLCALSALRNRLTGTTLAVAPAPDLVARLASGAPRVDIRSWRFCPGSGEAVPPEEEMGFRAGYYRGKCDTSEWTVVPHLCHLPLGGAGYSPTLYPGYGWYRTQFSLTPSQLGRPVEFRLGGYDDQDWQAYWVYVNGVLIGAHQRKPGPHEPPVYTLLPGKPAYAALHFGTCNTLAVCTRGLDRLPAGVPTAAAERIAAGTNLVDQFISLGAPYHEVADWQVTGRRTEADDSHAALIVELAAPQDRLQATVAYSITAGEPALHKDVTVRNTSAKNVTLLELDVAHWPVEVAGWPDKPGLSEKPGLSGQPGATFPAQGFPCTVADEFFFGLAHPAGQSQARADGVLLRLLPGAELAPGGAYVARRAVIGVGAAGDARRAFVGYLERHGRRRRELRTFYATYGAYDIAGIDEPTPISEALVETSLDQLAALQQRGVAFDYYTVDAGWSDPQGDLRGFDPEFFPHGPERLLERVRALGMKLCLWMSPAGGPMAFRPQGYNPALAGCGALPADPAHPERHAGSLCLAAEPWRTLFREAVLHHVRAYGARALKLDGNEFFCTNPAHSHWPGKYSAEPIMDATIDALGAARRECPELMVLYYWSIRSPWWLLWGDLIYERGVLMEGSTPSDQPAPVLRQSVNLSFDQAAHFAWDTLPLASQDSLGVWLSTNRWGNYMGAEGWRDAWVLDIGRGSLIAQLWGDLGLLNAEDLGFLAEIWAWQQGHQELLRTLPQRILGDPWQAEPYGYAYWQEGSGAIFLYNPTFEAHVVGVTLPDMVVPSPLTPTPSPSRGERGQDDDPVPDVYELRAVYPRDAVEEPVRVSGPEIEIALRPFEVRLVEIAPFRVPGVRHGVGATPLRHDAGQGYGVPANRQMPLTLVEQEHTPIRLDDPASEREIRRAVNGRAQYVDTPAGLRLARIQADERDRRIARRRYTGQVTLPPLAGPATLLVTARLARDGVYWHHHALYDILRLRASLHGQGLPIITTPHRWHEEAGGWCWIVFAMPVPATPSAVAVDLALEAWLPEGVEIEVTSVIRET